MFYKTDFFKADDFISQVIPSGNVPQKLPHKIILL